MAIKKDVVIFDLDGTLALIDDRRALATKDNGKMDNKIVRINFFILIFNSFNSKLRL